MVWIWLEVKLGFLVGWLWRTGEEEGHSFLGLGCVLGGGWNGKGDRELKSQSVGV